MPAPPPLAVDEVLAGPLAAHAVDEVLAGPPAAHADDDDLDGRLELGRLLGKFADAPAEPVRYRQWDIVRRVGRGSSGAVYEALDTQLGRRVAIKLLRPGPANSETQGHQRLRHEARALATIDHPHVCRVHRVDLDDRGTVLEMEYIDGRTLEAWQQDQPWRLIIDAYLAAGAGLAAIHGAGLVHRDIKARNILRADLGAIKVADLGLAVSMDSAASAPLAGTPGYIAPELLVGIPATPASDQFSLACALYHALFSVLPYPLAHDAFLATVRRGYVTFPTKTHPAWLRAALTRALLPDPAQRFPSVADFMHALRRGLRRRTLAILVPAVLLVLAGLVMLGRFTRTDPPDPCLGVGDPFTALWSSTARDTLLVRVVDPPARRSFDLLDRALAERTRGLADVALGICAVERRALANVPNDTAGQHACLDHARRQLTALVTTLQAAPPRAGHLADALALVDSLPRCDLRTDASIPAGDSIDDTLIDALADAAAREVAGDLDGAAAIAHRLAGSDTEHHPRRRAEALYRLGHVLGQQHRPTAAFAALDDARNLALAAGHDDLVCQAAAYQAKLASNVVLDPRASARELALAAACITRIGARSIRLRGDLLEAQALLALAADDLAGAVQSHRDALALRREHLGDDDLDTIRSHHNLANALALAGRPDDADAHLGIALSAYTRRLGPDHPKVGDVLFDLGESLRERDPIVARAHLEHAEKLHARIPNDSLLVRIDLALALLDLTPLSPDPAALAAAEQRLRRARERLDVDHDLNPVHPDRVALLQTEALLALRRGDFAGARDRYTHATDLLRRRDPTAPAVLDNILREIESAYGDRSFTAITAHVAREPDSLRAHLGDLAPAEQGRFAWYIADALAATADPRVVDYLRLAIAAYTRLDDHDALAELERSLARYTRRRAP